MAGRPSSDSDGRGTSTLSVSLESIIFDRRTGRKDTRSRFWDERKSTESLDAKEGGEDLDFFLGGDTEEEWSPPPLLSLSFLFLDRSLDLPFDLEIEKDWAIDKLEVEEWESLVLKVRNHPLPNLSQGMGWSQWWTYL